MASNKNEKWIETELMHRIKENNSIFRDATIQNCLVKALETMKDNWASMMFEVNVTLVDDGEKKIVSLLVKLEHENQNVRGVMRSENQFSNEVHFYSVAWPTLLSRVPKSMLKTELENLVPKCYYTHIKKGTRHVAPYDGVIVLEDLKVKGYKLGSRTFLDLQHCTVAMKSIGMFHAVSYFVKEREPELLEEMVKPIIETNYVVDGREILNSVFGAYQLRVIDALAAEVPANDPGLVRLRAVAARDAFDHYTSLVIPRDPLAVFCHGDFLRNNVLFGYDEDDAPVSMKLIDFQTIRYASPAIDLSLFLCMNTSHALRREHFARLLRTYSDSVRATLAALLGVGVERLPPRYAFEAFMEDFRAHALYGYLIAVEFLTWMMVEEEELAEIVRLNWSERGSPRHNEYVTRVGGAKVTNALLDLAKDLLAHECL